MENTVLETYTAAKTDTRDLTLPDPRILNIKELKVLFLEVSKEFTDRLAYSKAPQEVRLLEILHNYIKSVIFEIELKDKAALASL